MQPPESRPYLSLAINGDGSKLKSWGHLSRPPFGSAVTRSPLFSLAPGSLEEVFRIVLPLMFWPRFASACHVQPLGQRDNHSSGFSAPVELSASTLNEKKPPRVSRELLDGVGLWRLNALSSSPASLAVDKEYPLDALGQVVFAQKKLFLKFREKPLTLRYPTLSYFSH